MVMEVRQATKHMCRAFMKVTSTVSLVEGTSQTSRLFNDLVYVAGVWNNFRTAQLVPSMFLVKSG
jgi:hypothetical protein